MHKKGIVDYLEPKGISHKVITRIHRSCEELKDYVPKFSLRKAKKTQGAQGETNSGVFAGNGLRYPRVDVSEVF